MSDDTAERTYRAALQMWAGTGHVGAEPRREQFAHLAAVDTPPDDPHDDAAPQTPAAPHAEAVRDALRTMHEATGVRAPQPPDDAA